jgi:catalase
VNHTCARPGAGARGPDHVCPNLCCSSTATSRISLRRTSKSALAPACRSTGLNFSNDKMLVGWTFSYSDTQRYRVGPNYLQLPVNSPKNAKVATNQRDGQMTYLVDTGGENPHINYAPSTMGGLGEADYPTHDEQGPLIQGRLTRARIPRTNDCQQAGERFRMMEDWERDDLVRNFVELIGQAAPRCSGGWCGTSS